MVHNKYYEIAAEEVARQSVDKGLFARSYATALGDAEKTKAIYIGLRAENLELQANEQAKRKELEQLEKIRLAKHAEAEKKKALKHAKIVQDRQEAADSLAQFEPKNLRWFELPKTDDETRKMGYLRSFAQVIRFVIIVGSITIMLVFILLKIFA